MQRMSHRIVALFMYIRAVEKEARCFLNILIVTAFQVMYPDGTE